MCVLFPFLFFLHGDILGLAYLKSLILKIILCIRMRSGGRAAAPGGAFCGSRDTQSQGCCWRSQVLFSWAAPLQVLVQVLLL